MPVLGYWESLIGLVVCGFLLSLILPVLALVVAIRASNRASRLEELLLQLERKLNKPSPGTPGSSTILSPATPESGGGRVGAAPGTPGTLGIPGTSPGISTIPSPTVDLGHGTLDASAPGIPGTPSPTLDVGHGTLDASRRVPRHISSQATREVSSAASASPLLPPVIPQASPPPAKAPAKAPVAAPMQAASASPLKPAKKPLTGEAAVVRLYVWVGGIVLALAGIIFVNYARQMGFLKPEFRLSMGALFGLGLVLAGQWLHRRSAGVAQAAVAAGIAVLMGVLLAGIHFEQLISPTVGFVLLAITAGAAVFLSLRHGIFVALLGLIGGFATPALVGSDSNNPGGLFAYLLVIQVGLIVVTRMRGWWWITLLSLVGGFIWALVWICFFWTSAQASWVSLFLLGSTLAFVLGSQPVRQQVGQAMLISVRDILRWLAMLVGVSMACVVVARAGFNGYDWGYVGIMVAGGLALGRLDARQVSVTWMSLILCLGTLGAWHLSGVNASDHSLYFTVVASLGLLFALGGYGCMWGANQPVLWACLSVVGALGHLLLGYAQTPEPAWDHMWGTLCLLIGAGYAVAAAPLAVRRDAGDTTHDLPLAALAVGIIAFLALAVPIELERQWISVAWVVMIPAVAWVQMRLKVKGLGWVSLALAAGVAIRLLCNPFILNYPIGQTIIFNVFLYGYGVPVLALLLAARLYRQMENMVWDCLLSGLSLLLFTALVVLEIRHGFQGPSMMGTAAVPSLLQGASYYTAFLILAIALLAWHQRKPHPVAIHGAMALIFLASLMIGLVLISFVSSLLSDSIWFTNQIGSMPVFNALLYIYGLPMMLLAVLSWQMRGLRFNSWSVGLGQLTLILLVALVTLEIRHGFQGSNLMHVKHGASLIQWATYCVAYLLLAIGLLDWHRRSPHPVANYGGTFHLILSCFLVVCVLLGYRNPLWSRSQLGTMPVLNFLLYVYGLPMTLLAILAWQTNKISWQSWSKGLWTLALVLLSALVSLEIRHGFQGPNAMQIDHVSSLIQWATYPSAFLLLAIGLLAYHRRKPHRVACYGGLAHIILACALVMCVLLLRENPLWNYHHVGATPVFNSLLYIYGLPMLLLGMLIWKAMKLQWSQWATGLGIAALVLLFVLVSLQVRQGFQGGWLNGSTMTDMERYSYSLAWVLLGVGLLVAGISTRSRLLRWASLVVMLLTIGKTFLDVLGLRDPLRVFSLLGLGLALLGLGLLYHKFVFHREPAEEVVE